MANNKILVQLSAPKAKVEEANSTKKLIALSSLAAFLGLLLLSFPTIADYLTVQDPVDPSVLGDSTTPLNSTNRRIAVDLTTQHLYGFENNQKVFDFVISSGKWNRTPTGTFKVWAKVRSQKMSGGSKELGTYYYLPNVPYILFFYNDKVAKKTGYSLHGTYWHNNFGVPMSHGCINMKTSDVAQIYNWATVGTTITIYGKYNASLANK